MTIRTVGLVAAAVALAVLGLVLIFNSPEQPAPAPTTGPSTGAPTSTAPDPATGFGHVDEDPAQDEDHAHDHDVDPAVQRQQHQLVEGFARAFTAPGAQARWLAGVKPYVSPQLYQGLSLTDPTRRPAGRVASVSAIAEPSGLFTVLYDNGTEIKCTLTATTSGGWLITSVEPIRPPDPTGTDVG